MNKNELKNEFEYFLVQGRKSNFVSITTLINVKDILRKFNLLNCIDF